MFFLCALVAPAKGLLSSAALLQDALSRPTAVVPLVVFRAQLARWLCHLGCVVVCPRPADQD